AHWVHDAAWSRDGSRSVCVRRESCNKGTLIGLATRWERRVGAKTNGSWVGIRIPLSVPKDPKPFDERVKGLSCFRGGHCTIEACGAAGSAEADWTQIVADFFGVPRRRAVG